jgi:hypothetical protein
MAWTATPTEFLDGEDTPQRPYQPEAKRPAPADGFGVIRLVRLLRPERLPANLDRAAASAEVLAAERPTAAYLARCIVLQVIGASLIVALWIAGLAQKPFEGDNAFLCWAIVGIGALGIAAVFLRRWNDVQWIATHVVRIGLLGTVVGLIIAFSAAGSGDASNADSIKPMIAAVVSGMYVSLYATLLGIATNLWLKINLRVLGNNHG